MTKRRFKSVGRNMMRTLGNFNKKKASLDKHMIRSESKTAEISKRVHLPTIKSKGTTARTPFNCTESTETPFINTAPISMVLSSHRTTLNTVTPKV